MLNICCDYKIFQSRNFWNKLTVSIHWCLYDNSHPLLLSVQKSVFKILFNTFDSRYSWQELLECTFSLQTWWYMSSLFYVRFNSILENCKWHLTSFTIIFWWFTFQPTWSHRNHSLFVLPIFTRETHVHHRLSSWESQLITSALKTLVPIHYQPHRTSH